MLSVTPDIRASQQNAGRSNQARVWHLLDVGGECHISQPEQAQDEEQREEATIGDVRGCRSCWTLRKPWAVLHSIISVYMCATMACLVA